MDTLAGKMCVMTESTATRASVELLRRTHVGVAAAGVGALVGLVVVLLMLLDKVEVLTQQGLRDVEFGAPLNWVTQDQALDPLLPYSASFASPWEHSTTVDWLTLALNLAIAGVVLVGAWRATLLARSRRSSR